MTKDTYTRLGELPISRLLIEQAGPAAIGILVMSLNILVDSIFLGNWIGPMAIAAINVVLPISFFIAAIGMAIGAGGASVISRALGAGNLQKARRVFGNQITMTTILTTLFVVPGLFFWQELLLLFGGKGAIFSLAKTYYIIVLSGVPLLGYAMMGSAVIRAEGHSKAAMVAMILPAVVNLTLDYVFISLLDLQMQGAALATVFSYGVCFLYILYFFTYKKQTVLDLGISDFLLQKSIVKEIAALAGVTMARQATISCIYLVLNTILFDLGKEPLVAVYAIIGRMLMFAFFPVYGITQGFVPIAGYNYGAKKLDRVKRSVYVAILYGSVLATLIFLILAFFPRQIAAMFLPNAAKASVTDFTTIQYIKDNISIPMRFVFGAAPILAVQLIGAAYFQAIGKATKALFLTLSRQFLFFIPLVFLLSHYYAVLGVWLSFFIADVLATIVTAYFLYQELRTFKNNTTV